MTHVPYDATECACGHSFEFDKPDLTRTAEVLRTESEERLYQAYLEARMQQTLDELQAVREECGSGKWTREQVEKVRHALRAVEFARRDLHAQHQRAINATEAAQVAKQRRAQRQAGKSRSESVMPAVPGFSTAMPDNQRATQARKTESLSPPTHATQSCPHCSATVSIDARHCSCGYEFPVMTLVPELVLPAEKYVVVDPSDPTSTAS